MAKRYYWLKLKNNFFSQPRIKKLRRIAGGDTYTIIYLKMQLLSLADDGKLYFEGIEDSFAEEVALTIDEDVENVVVTIGFLMNQGLIEQIDDNTYLMTETQMLIGSESEGAERVRKCRAKQKALCSSETKALHCNGDVTDCNTEIESREKSIDKDIENRVDRGNEAKASPSPKINYQEWQNTYNFLCTSLPYCRSLTDKRKAAIRSAIKQGITIGDFRTACEKANASSFMTGNNQRGWKANPDFMFNANNITKILEGNYDDKDKHEESWCKEYADNPDDVIYVDIDDMDKSDTPF